jgi:hypothetical protein
VRDNTKLELSFKQCGRCMQEKEVIDFFFNWRCASGLYRLCEGCINELKNAFPKKVFGVVKEEPQLDTGLFTVIKEAVGIIKRFFEK